MEDMKYKVRLVNNQCIIKKRGSMVTVNLTGDNYIYCGTINNKWIEGTIKPNNWNIDTFIEGLK